MELNGGDATSGRARTWPEHVMSDGCMRASIVHRVRQTAASKFVRGIWVPVIPSFQHASLVLRILPALLCLYSCSDEHGAADRSLLPPKFESHIEHLRKAGSLPSLQLTVVEHGKIVYSRAMGQSADPDALYLIGSIQKVFTATAVLQLHERGLLDLDDDVNSYLQVPMRHPRFPTVPITIRMLLSHRSGLEMFRHQADWDMRFLTYRKDSSDVVPAAALLSRDEFLAASLDPAGINFDSTVWYIEPGTNYLYSNSAYEVLKHIIERVSSRSYSQFLNENIFRPLGMRHTIVYRDDTTARFATPYTRRDGVNIALPIWSGDRDFIWSTGEDLACFMIAHLNDGRYGDVRLLKPETIALMREPHSPGKSLFHLSSACPFSSYGLGLIHYSGDWFGHGGSTIGFQSLWSFNTSSQRGYVILTNVNGLIYGQKNFDAVWATVASIERCITSELQPPAVGRGVFIGCMIAFTLIVIVFAWRRCRVVVRPLAR